MTVPCFCKNFCSLNWNEFLSPARLWNEGGTTVKILEGCANKFLLVSTIGNVKTTVWRIDRSKRVKFPRFFSVPPS